MSETITISSAKKAMFLVAAILAYFASMFSLAGSAIFVSSAMTSLDGMTLFGLAITVESLFRCVLVPPSAKLGEKFLRRNLFMIGLLLFIVGAILCVIAWEPVLVVVSRAIMGLAWGLFFANLIAMVNDYYSPEKAPKINGIVQAFGFAAILVAGPTAGLFVDFMTWQWTVYVVIILCAIAFVIMLFVPNVQERGSQSLPLDTAGSICLLGVLLPFSFALTWAGTEGWTSPLVLGLLALAVVFLIVLIIVERKAKDPVFPGYLLKNKDLMMVFTIGAMFAGVCSVMIYLPSILQFGLGFSATESSFPSVALGAVGLILSYFVGARMAKTRKTKGLLFIEGIACAVCGIAMFFVHPGASLIFVVAAWAVCGIAQAIHQVAPISWPSIAMDPSKIAVTIGFMMFGQAIASTIFNAVLGAAFNADIFLPLYFVIGFAAIILLCTVIFKDPKSS